jgi:hypothetical protein
MQDASIEKQKHERFIKQTCQSGVVWGLENQDGFAMTSSAEFEDSDGEASEVLCFWSEVGMAKLCINDEWENYKTAKVELADFMENWCIGMFEDELLVGVDFDEQLEGLELDPLDLILELCEELKKNGSKINFEHYADIDEFVEEVKSIKAED